MTFRTDQWYDLTNQGEGGLRFSGDASATGAGYSIIADNDKFIYPRRQVRTIDGKGENQVTNLKRGYIRNISPSSGQDGFGVPSTKCQFQFNPQYLVQSVSQNTAILNFLQLDPAQYAQPVPGNVSFSFELFFDRSAELNSRALPTQLDSDSPWDSGPQHIGVLHDINAFYKVIGVGLSSEQQQYAKRVLEQQIVAEAEAANDSGSTYTAEDVSSYFTQSSNFLNMNAGNTAFLLPLPVRIVFSSLYIVEGLVRDVTVTFTKFNAAMVPMQATLNVLFEAKYIGFAKKDTFMQQAVDEWAANDFDEASEIDTSIDVELLRQYGEALTSDLSTLKVAIVDNSNDSQDTEYPIHYYLSNNLSLSSRSSLPKVLSNQDRNPDEKIEDRNLRIKVGFGNKDGQMTSASSSALYNQFATSNKDVNIKVYGDVTLWRFSTRVLEDPKVRDAWYKLITNNKGTSVGVITSDHGRYTSDSYGYTLSSALRSYSGPTESTYDDNGGNTRAFEDLIQVISSNLSESNVVEDVLGFGNNPKVTTSNNISGTSGLAALFNAGVTFRVTPRKNGGYYDRSLERDGFSEGDKFPEYKGSEGSPFYFVIQYNFFIETSIAGYQFPTARAVDYIVYDGRGAGNGNHADIDARYVYLTGMSMKLDWQELVDLIESEIAAEQARIVSDPGRASEQILEINTENGKYPAYY